MTRARTMWAAALLLAVAVRANAQCAPDTITLDQAIQCAADHYPTVRAALEQVTASQANADVARTAYLPRLDSLWQSNRATANNVFGQVLPQSVLPSLTGPVLASPSSASVWSSATGALLSWEPFDFGLRGAGVQQAETALARARADETLTRLQVEAAVGHAFLTVVAAEQAAAAAQADLDRRDVLQHAVHALVDNELRPGAEASRADAERAAAQIRVIRTKQDATLARITLSRLLGRTTGTVTVDAASLLTSSPGDATPAEAAAHPLARERYAAVEQARAAERVLTRTDYPRVYLESSVFARGSGADPGGVLDGGFDGLGLQRVNWAAGVQVVFPNVFDFSSLRARRAAAAATTRAATAAYDEAVLTVNSEQQAAAALLAAARAIATNTPVQLASARLGESQARARYNAGLTNVLEVADAQSLLAQAEMDDAIAHVDIWRAQLAEALAQGDLAPFLRRVSGR